MNINECRFSCPNCGASITDQVLEIVKYIEQEKSDLMTISVHDLFAPLDSAYGKTEHLTTLVSDLNNIISNSGEIQELCRNIDKDIIRTIHKVNSFRYFATMGTEAESYKFDRFAIIDNVLKNCADDFQYLAKKRGIEIKLNYLSDRIPSANFDEDKLEILFSNLLDNAVKYSHANKVINANVAFDDNSEIYTISISDFGLGIPDSELDKIFDKYYRSKLMDPRRFIPGTGIGLTVAKQIVEKHGGKIWVTSKQGPSTTGTSSPVEGSITTFWVQIHRQRRKL